MNVEQFLTSTRSARKTLDLNAPDDLDEVRECLRIGLQAANGTNLQSWRWLIVTDQDLRTHIAALYRKAYLDKVGGQLIAGFMPAGTPRRGSCHRRSGWSSIWVRCPCW
jgi:nitroreductase